MLPPVQLAASWCVWSITVAWNIYVVHNVFSFLILYPSHNQKKNSSDTLRHIGMHIYLLCGGEKLALLVDFSPPRCHHKVSAFEFPIADTFDRLCDPTRPQQHKERSPLSIWRHLLYLNLNTIIRTPIKHTLTTNFLHRRFWFTQTPFCHEHPIFS